MKCHYQVLDVERNASDDDIKKAYRKLALKWHPDKNRENEAEATAQFRLVQQAYDVLSDPQERAWYDNHRDQILRGGFDGDYEDKSLNVFPYFTASCFSGFGDDDGGFYSVYREVFKTVAAEDMTFMEDGESDVEVPEFGNSQSNFPEVVGPFYAFWQSYCTRKTYSWLDQHDIRQAPNRWVLRQMEKDNKKIRIKAKKERNEQIRALVGFVRKRDVRVEAQRQLLAEKAAENVLKQQQDRDRQRLQRLDLLNDYREAEWSRTDQHEHMLAEMEASIARQFGETPSESDDSDSDEQVDLTLYCTACDKLFKTDKALKNHEGSKKHRDNVALLKEAMLEQDRLLNGGTENDGASAGCDGESHDRGSASSNGVSNGRGPATFNGACSDHGKSADSDSRSDAATDVDLSEKAPRHQRKDRKKRRRGPAAGVAAHHVEEDDGHLPEELQSPADALAALRLDPGTEQQPQSPKQPAKLKGKKAKDARKKAKAEAVVTAAPVVCDGDESDDGSLTCKVCRNEFQSKNKLFEHIKKTGHAALKPNAAKRKTAKR